MRVQIVMDRAGDTRHEFDASEAAAVTRAAERFQELTGKGFRAVALGKEGEHGELMRAFDPSIERTLFIPQLQGG
jgi:alpha-D-ribose 1-methylphosphonate 5-triphosphate synthase subunit PhnG